MPTRPTLLNLAGVVLGFLVVMGGHSTEGFHLELSFAFPHTHACASHTHGGPHKFICE